jgi:hypothetical protein
MTEQPAFTIVNLMLSVQCALVGEVTANMAALTCALRPNLIILRGYYFTAPTEDDRERLSVVGTEVIADFPAPYDIVEECVRYEPSGDMPERLDRWAFMRAEVEDDVRKGPL